MHGLLAGGGATDKHGNPKAGPSEGKRRWLVLIATHRRRIEQCPLAVSSDVNTGGAGAGCEDVLTSISEPVWPSGKAVGW